MGCCANCGGRGIAGSPCSTCEDTGMIYEGSVDSDVDTDVDSDVNFDDSLLN